MAEMIIPLDVFLSTKSNPDKYKNLAINLDAYKCFVTNGGERERGLDTQNTNTAGSRRYGGSGRKGHGHGHGHRQPNGNSVNRMRLERPKIGMRELSREAMCKKEFLSLTNKVSPQNKDAIVQKMLAALTPQYATMYCTVIWTIMQRPVQIYQNIYAEFARIVAINTPMPDKQVFKGAWEECFSKVTQGDNAFVHVPTEFHDVSDDGTFHEWTIWKKCRINLVKGCVYLCFYGVFTKTPSEILAPVMSAVDEALLTNSPQTHPPHILDYWLDILGVSWDAEKEIQQPLSASYMQKLKSWAQYSGTLPPKCRFKIDSLREAHCSAK